MICSARLSVFSPSHTGNVIRGRSVLSPHRVMGDLAGKRVLDKAAGAMYRPT